MDAYSLIIAGSLAIIISHFFGEVSKWTNIPSVIMLIATGVVLNQVVDVDQQSLMKPLEVLGTIGLIMIVLEGALDLELSKERLPMIWRALAIALLGVITSTIVIGAGLKFFFAMTWGKAFLYSVPMAIISSAIVIPSIGGLREKNREFVVYESCLSDILGIMMFYFVVGFLESGDLGGMSFSFVLNFILTVVISVVVSLALIFLFKYVKNNVKLFLFIAILIVIYAVGKLLHLSSLILILVFGLILKNHGLLFRGPLKNVATRMELKLMERNFHIITRETAFILRTFFFIVFGITIDLSRLLDLRVMLLSISVMLIIIAVRWLLLTLIKPKSIQPLLYLAPRGLITVLLFYSIPTAMQSANFQDGVILYVVIFSSVFMSYGLILNRVKKWEYQPVADGSGNTAVEQLPNGNNPIDSIPPEEEVEGEEKLKESQNNKDKSQDEDLKE